MRTIKPEDLDNIPNKVIIDTRSPKEHKVWKIPNSINIPILDNEQRAIVGILYKKVSREAAIKKGEELVFGDENALLNKYLPYKNKTIIVHCWRGGMRSGRIVTWLEKHNFDVMQLEGGIKAHREHIREYLEKYKFKKLIAIWGKTGSGKTNYIKTLKNGLDLEGLAQHRSSIYGAVGKQPNTQKNFEALLYNRLKELDKFDEIITEGEAQKIGNLFIPDNIYAQIKKAIHYRLETPLQKRIDIIEEDYFTGNNEFALVKATEAITKQLGKKKVALLLGLLQTDKREFIRILLEEYYDPLYAHTIDNKKYEKILKYEEIMS